MPPLTDGPAPDPALAGPPSAAPSGAADARPGTGDPLEWYRARRAGAEARAGELDARSARLSRGRVLSFLASIAPLLLLETSPRAWWPLLLLSSAGGFILFFYLLVRHRRVRVSLVRARLRARAAAEGMARIARRWVELPRPRLGPVPPGHPWGDDLDVLGRASLAHLLGTVTTAPGRAALRDALLDPGAGPPEDPARWIARLSDAEATSSDPLSPAPPHGERRRARRASVDALAADPGFRETLQVLGREVEGEEDPAALAEFLEWARGPAWRGDRRWAVPLARLLGLANPTLLVAWLAGWIALPFWVVGVVVALALHRRIAPEAARRFHAAEAAEGTVSRWAALLDAGAAAPGDAPLLGELRSAMAGQDGRPAGVALLRLQRITDWAAVRRSALTHFPLVALTAWDVHVLERLDAWRARHGASVDAWVRALGEFELLAALATLRFDHPGWVFPEEGEPGAEGITASRLAHPLLAPDRAVANDVAVPAPGRLLLVTGSNMSGKSTLLRALGTNQLLMLAGGPVAAAAFRAPPIHPWTAMRIRDSLSEGVSFFLAELRRLQDVVESAREAPTLVLLDEILQGTNTAERRIAARTILRHLLRAGAIGAVSTHDLTLAAAPDLAPRLGEVHFRESVADLDGARTLSFDHRLRDGPATTRNAILLLEMVGLGAHPDDPEERVDGPEDGGRSA